MRKIWFKFIFKERCVVPIYIVRKMYPQRIIVSLSVPTFCVIYDTTCVGSMSLYSTNDHGAFFFIGCVAPIKTIGFTSQYVLELRKKTRKHKSELAPKYYFVLWNTIIYCSSREKHVLNYLEGTLHLLQHFCSNLSSSGRLYIHVYV